MRWGFQRQDQPFHERTGPPWTHSSSGNGPSPSGSTSQDRSGLPSSAVVVTSSSRPGGARRGRRALQERRAPGRPPTGRAGPGRARVDGVAQGVGRAAVGRDPHVGVVAAVAGQADDLAARDVDAEDRRRALLVGDDDAAPAPSGVQAGRPGQRSQPEVTSRGRPTRRAAPRRSAMSTGSSGVLSVSRRKATVEPSGLTTGAPHSAPGSSNSVVRSPVAVSTATRTVRREPTGSATDQVTTAVRPSGLTSTSASCRPRPGVGREVAPDELAGRSSAGVAGEQALLADAEVVVPVAHGVAGVQHRVDAGVLAGRAPLGVAVAVGRAGQRVGQRDDGAGLARHGDRAEPAGPRADDPGLTRRRQHPQRGGRVVGRLRGGGVGPGGGEQQRRRRARTPAPPSPLALRVSRRAGALAGRVDLPQRARPSGCARGRASPPS